jgi:hypothetical protein
LGAVFCLLGDGLNEPFFANVAISGLNNFKKKVSDFGGFYGVLYGG